MKLEVGEFYLSAKGEMVSIYKVNNKDMFEDSSGLVYKKDGVIFNGNNNYDLIAHIPKQLHFRLCEIVKDYHIDIDVKEFIDNNYKMMKGRK